MLKDSNIANILPVIFEGKQSLSLQTNKSVEAEFSASKDGCDAYFKMPDGTEIDIHLSEAVFSPKEKTIYLRSETYAKSFIIKLEATIVSLITDILNEMEGCAV